MPEAQIALFVKKNPAATCPLQNSWVVATQTNLQHRLFSILKQVNTNFSELELKSILALDYQISMLIYKGHQS